jgi:hypothetical protein
MNTNRVQKELVFMQTLLLIAVIFLFIWTATVTFFLVRSVKHYQELTVGISKLGLREILEKILREKKDLKARVETLESAVTDVASHSLSHIQKIGVHRFNPFEDTGGSQSFTIAFLNRYESGLVMTSLYARTGNRWYVKEVVNGKGIPVELSKEETKAVKDAKISNLEVKE